MKPPPTPRPDAGAGTLRVLGLLAFWFVLVGLPAAASWESRLLEALPDLLAGALAAAVATWASLRLLPPGEARVSVAGLTRLAAHFIRQSFVAGVDVARRAFSPRLPLQPGFVEHRCRLPAGPARDAFVAMSSLLPGTVPVRDGDDGAVLYHSLDTRQPVAAQLARDEGVFAAAVAPGRPPT
ncbi:MAG: Na+/H+ antiporter subunit E [Limisphaerales bacterium]